MYPQRLPDFRNDSCEKCGLTEPVVFSHRFLIRVNPCLAEVLHHTFLGPVVVLKLGVVRFGRFDLLHALADPDHDLVKFVG